MDGTSAAGSVAASTIGVCADALEKHAAPARAAHTRAIRITGNSPRKNLLYTQIKSMMDAKYLMAVLA
jgi:hypothetical protein